MKNLDFYNKEIFIKEPKLRNSVIKNLKRYLIKKSKYKLNFDPRIKKFRNYKGFKVFFVNGNLIRNKIDIDFVMGGNGLRYLYVPLNEIWIEDVYKNKKEVNAILLHEYAELNLMKKGLTYSKAHDNASVKELIKRRR